MVRQRRVTIDDVASAANVSRQTVSNVLRGTGRVGVETAERVREVVDRLGYVVHPGARSLRSLRTGQIAFPLDELAMDQRDVLGLEFVRELTAAAGTRGYHVLLMTPGMDAIAELIRSARVDGFVFANLRRNDPRIAAVTDRGVPFACMGRTESFQRQAWVDIANGEMVRLAIEHVVQRGHREVTYLGYNLTEYWDAERLTGYEDTMKSLGLVPRSILTDNDEAPMARAAAEAIGGDSPSAIVCASDELAAAVYGAAVDRGLTVGRDLVVTGVGFDVVGRGLSPSLTTVPVPMKTVAELVMRRFMYELEGGPDLPGEFIVPELIVGASTGG
jgi:DNA-binding LacI/PurR family transcriptional regulator